MACRTIRFLNGINLFLGMHRDGITASAEPKAQ
jgi:hypothetical protein